MSNCKVIALTNQKGGVGKTTTAVNLGVGLAKQGKKVLLIDADAQANLTMALGYNRPDDIPITLSTVMQSIIDDKSFDASGGILHHGEGIDLLPSNIELSGFEVRLINAMSRERVLKTYVNEVRKNYDYVLIDCMPSLGMITINALAAADSVIIPTQPHYLSAKGLELLLRSVSMVKRQINPKLRIDGILMTMVMPRTNISKEITATVKSAYGQRIKVFSFSHTYDSSGNAMRYNSSATFDGHTAGGTGNYKYRMFVDGENAFCIQPGVPLNTGNTLKKASSDTWNALSANQKKAVGLALLYGYQGNRSNLTGSDDEKWVATQTLVWEFVTGCREATGSFSKTSDKVYSLHFGSNYANSGAKAAYDQIVSLMSEHHTIPSFMSGSKNGITKELYRYVTEQTFDAYLYQLVESKQKFISQIMTSKSPVRSAEDVDEVALSFAEVKMLATGDERFKEKMDLDIQVSKLKVLKQSYLSEHYDLEDRILKYFPQTVKEYEQRIVCYEVDTALAEQNKPQGEEKFCAMTLRGIKYTEKAAAGEMLLAICKEYPLSTPTEIGSYRGFKMEVFYDTVNAHYCLNLCGKAKYKVDLGFDPLGNLTRIENELAKLPARLEAAKTKRTETIAQFETAKVEVQKPFAFEGELKEKSERLNALNIELNLDKKDPAVLDAEPEQSEEQPERKCENRER